MLESFKKLSNLILDGNLVPGEPRFDPSALTDVKVIGNTVTFYIDSKDAHLSIKSLEIPFNDLTLDEARIAYKYYLDNYDRKEDETKSILDPRPWKHPVWDLKFWWYLRWAFLAIMFIIFLVGASYSYMTTHQNDRYLDPAVNIAKNNQSVQALVQKYHSSASYNPSVQNPADFGYRYATNVLIEVDVLVSDNDNDPSGMKWYRVLVDPVNQTVLDIKYIGP